MNNLVWAFFIRMSAGAIIAVLLGLLCSVLCIINTGEKQAALDFETEITRFYGDLEIRRQRLQQDPKTFYLELSNENIFLYDFEWLDADYLSCEHCKPIKINSELKVYENEEFNHIGYLKLEQGGLVFKENAQLLYPLYDVNYPGDVIDPIVFLTLILVFVCIAIYIPIKQLQSQFEVLISANKAFAEGNYSARVKQSMSAPMSHLAKCFNEMADEISQSMIESKAFSKMAPHEFRTPLNRLQLSVGLLNQDIDSKTKKEVLVGMNKNILDLDSLCQQLVVLMSLKGGEVADHEETINLVEFIHSRILAVSSSDEKNITLKCQEVIEIETVPILFRVIIDNLIRNAIQHSQSTILVTIKSLAQNVTINVEDDGKGFRDSDYNRTSLNDILSNYKQHSFSSGYGVGLTLVYCAARRLNISTHLKRSQFGGTKFSIKFKNTRN